jgi:folate-binding Fe-S cluster repair protein YgfZ
VSFTKGCYTGQELVARIDSRGGNVPRHLRRIRIEGALPPPGATLHAGDKQVGVLTSVAPARDGTPPGAVALGYVGRAVEVPATLTVRWDGGSATATGEALS